MESTTIFIVTECGGEYDDSWERNVRAFRLKEDAEKYVADATAQIDFANSISPAVIKLYHNCLSVPVPELEMTDPYPKRSQHPVKQTWAEHAVEVREWTNKNEAVIARNNRRNEAHRKECYSEAVKYATALGATEKHLSIMGFKDGHFDKYSGDSDVTYQYEELELL